jgi:hypothetical protein
MSTFDEIELVAKQYQDLKQNKAEESKNIAVSIIDYLSSPDLKFPLRKEGLVSNGTTSFVYKGNAAYPKLFEFISEIIHSEIPVTIDDVKFGPGEIIVNKENQKEAENELASGIRELQKLIHGKRSEMFRL